MKLLKLLIAALLINVAVTCCYRTVHADCQKPLAYVTATEDRGFINLAVTQVGDAAEVTALTVAALARVDGHVVRLSYYVHPPHGQDALTALYASPVYKALAMYGITDVIMCRFVDGRLEAIIMEE